MILTNVRFTQPIHLGRALDLHSFLEPGTRVSSDPVDIAWFNDTFLRISFRNGNYSQLVPWSQVAAVLYTESKPAVTSKQRP